ncbi:class C sortase [Actinomycetaceae bacterium TAE3-ERU4]|nr:class C sortase [Actinomycetaceae bacterium TAE3-ERU4]
MRKTIWRKLTNFAPAILVLLGALVMIYPVIATNVNDARQRQIAAQYDLEVAKAGPDLLAESIDKARKYNDHIVAHPILDPWLNRVTPNSPEYQAYIKELAVTSEIGRLKIGKIDVDLPIYHGTSTRVLAMGVGHLFGSSLPVGGVGTHAVLTGHSALGTATLFDNLPKLQNGDLITLMVSGETFAYRVTGKRVVLPHETESLGAVPGKDLITLITCTPYGVNTHRLLVTAERTELPPPEVLAKVAPEKTWWQRILQIPYWMILMTTAAIAGTLFSLWFLFYTRRGKKEADTSEE